MNKISLQKSRKIPNLTIHLFIIVGFFFVGVVFYYNSLEFRSSIAAFQDTWKGEGYYKKYLDAEKELLDLKNTQVESEIQNQENSKNSECFEIDFCVEGTIYEIEDYLTPSVLQIRSSIEIPLGSFVISGKNFVGSIVEKRGELYKVVTIFNSDKKYSVRNLGSTASGVAYFDNSTLKMKSLSINDIFNDGDIILVHESDNKVLPNNYFIGKLKKFKEEFVLENYLDFHFITKVGILLSEKS